MMADTTYKKKKYKLILTGVFCTVGGTLGSPELKAQVSFSDCPLSGIRPSVNFCIFDFFSRTTGPILTRLGTYHSCVKGI
jgi:hypothetical protein